MELTYIFRHFITAKHCRLRSKPHNTLESQQGSGQGLVDSPAVTIGMTLILSLITAFKYGKSWVLANVIVSSRDGNVEWISDINFLSLS